MNAKEKLKNDVIIGMRMYLDALTLGILEQVIVQACRNMDIQEQETLPATIDNTNSYILEMFMARKACKLKPKTVEAYLRTVREFMAFIDKPITKAEEADVECYLFQKQKMDNNNVSLNNNRRNLSAFFTWMRKVKLISENHCDAIEAYKQDEKPIDHLEATDWELLKKGCWDARSRALMEFMRCTAMRRGEIPQVKISDIDFATGKIVVYGHKTNRYRTVFLDKVAIFYIRQYMSERNVTETSELPLFTHLKGDITRTLEDRGIYAVIKLIAQRAGIEKRIYPHLFRKTTATNIVKRGGSIDAAGEYLGHAPRNVTGKHYTYMSPQYTEKIFHEYVEAV